MPPGCLGKLRANKASKFMPYVLTAAPFAVLIGMGAGFCLFLAGILALLFGQPMRRAILAGTVGLGLLVAGAIGVLLPVERATVQIECDGDLACLIARDLAAK